jgi:hypothetical protein
VVTDMLKWIMHTNISTHNMYLLRFIALLRPG